MNNPHLPSRPAPGLVAFGEALLSGLIDGAETHNVKPSRLPPPRRLLRIQITFFAFLILLSEAFSTAPACFIFADNTGIKRSLMASSMVTIP